jgi:hypothetical protein
MRKSRKVEEIVEEEQKQAEAEAGLPEVEDTIDTLDTIDSEKITNRPRKRRKRKSSEKSSLDNLDYAKQTISAMFNAVFNILAMRLGEHWVLSSEENLILTESAFNVLKVYIPDIDEKKMALIMFGATLGIVVVPRLMKKEEKTEDFANIVKADE